jgi:Flp pilus assembly protein protease CpaA
MIFYNSMVINNVWGMKGPKGPMLLVLTIYFWQRAPIALQKMQAYTIFNWVVIVGLTAQTIVLDFKRENVHTLDILFVVDRWKMFCYFSYWT